MDGPMGSGSWMEAFAKHTTWVGRRRDNLAAWRAAFKGKPRSLLARQRSMTFVCSHVLQTWLSLNRVGCLVWQTKGEADPFIGKIFRSRPTELPAVAAVISEDSDFAIMRDARLLLASDLFEVVGGHVSTLFHRAEAESLV